MRERLVVGMRLVTECRDFPVWENMRWVPNILNTNTVLESLVYVLNRYFIHTKDLWSLKFIHPQISKIKSSNQENKPIICWFVIEEKEKILPLGPAVHVYILLANAWKIFWLNHTRMSLGKTKRILERFILRYCYNSLQS